MPFSASVLRAPVRIGKKRVAAVDHDVARLKMRQHMIDHLVHGIAGLHHQHHAARPLQQAGQLLNRVRAHHLRPLGFVGQKVVHLGNGAVEHGNFEAVVVHVEDKVLSHHCKADQADIARCIRHFHLRKQIFHCEISRRNSRLDLLSSNGPVFAKRVVAVVGAARKLLFQGRPWAWRLAVGSTAWRAVTTLHSTKPVANARQTVVIRVSCRPWPKGRQFYSRSDSARTPERARIFLSNHI